MWRMSRLRSTKLNAKRTNSSFAIFSWVMRGCDSKISVPSGEQKDVSNVRFVTYSSCRCFCAWVGGNTNNVLDVIIVKAN